VTLSVCTATNESGPRIRALLAILRDVADEIVVAADARCSEAQLEHYAVHADRVVRLEWGGRVERHLSWLHAQCRCDWVLRIDGDEVPSRGLLDMLPELTRRADVEQYLIPQRWLHPDTHHALDELPWWPDFHNRLVRRSGLLRFPGTVHTGAALAYPARYLKAPLYHLPRPAAERRECAARYEELQPGLEAPGGGGLNDVYYNPERYSRRDPVPVPPEDRCLIDAVAYADDRSTATGARRSYEFVSLRESDRWSAQREIPISAYHARLSLFGPPPRMAAGCVAAIYVCVRNEGSERWPWDPELQPLIWLDHGWVADDGRRGPGRTTIPCWLGPGEETVVPIVVRAPNAPGEHEFEIDLLHEGSRWFGVPCRIAVSVSSSR
jgi:hypothetical protein